MEALNNLSTAIEPMLTKLSEIFCVSADYIQAHLLEYVMEYGKYHLGTSIVSDIGVLIIIWLIVSIICTVGWTDVCKEDDKCDNWIKGMKRYLKFSVICFIIITIVIILLNIIPYFMSPTIYSIESVMDLLQSTQTS